MADWPEHAIWWQLHTISFTGPGPLTRIEAWLDYLVDLGCNGLLLGPIFASETHGYDTVDHFRIDLRLGTDEDFGHLVEQCQARGVRLLLDGVFNHVGLGIRAVPGRARARPRVALRALVPARLRRRRRR